MKSAATELSLCEISPRTDPTLTMSWRSNPNNQRCFQGGLPEAFLAGYHSAVSLVRAEISRPEMQRLNLRELEVMLRHQCEAQLTNWKRN